jgi:hypothetical protein
MKQFFKEYFHGLTDFENPISVSSLQDIGQFVKIFNPTPTSNLAGQST